MWVEPAAVSRGEQQRWVGLRAMKRLKSSVCQIEKHSCESGVKFERAGWVFSQWREKQKDFSLNFLWGRRAAVWGFRNLFCWVFFFLNEDVWRTFLEIFFTKQESVSEQILPAAERKCWRSAAVGEGNSSQKLNRVCQLHLLRSWSRCCFCLFDCQALKFTFLFWYEVTLGFLLFYLKLVCFRPR